MITANGAATPVEVVYVAGLGRSGSTLVGTVLGEANGLHYAGELRQFWQRNMLENRLCGCGQSFRDCAWWGRVVQRAFGAAGEPDPREMLRVQKTLRPLERSRRLVQGRDSDRHLALKPYRGWVEALYRAVRDECGGGLLVDSSKAADYLRFLTLLDGVRVYILHLVRDPRAAAHSWLRKRRQPDRGEELYMSRFGAAHTARRWIRRNRAVATVARITGARYRVLRYEEFVADPAATTGALLEWLGRPQGQGPRFNGPDTVELSENHGVWGNPSRFATGAVQVRVDDEWRRGMAPRDRWVVSLLTAPWRRRYGY